MERVLPATNSSRTARMHSSVDHERPGIRSGEYHIDFAALNASRLIAQRPIPYRPLNTGLDLLKNA